MLRTHRPAECASKESFDLRDHIDDPNVPTFRFDIVTSQHKGGAYEYSILVETLHYKELQVWSIASSPPPATKRRRKSANSTPAEKLDTRIALGECARVYPSIFTTATLISVRRVCGRL